MTRISQLRSEFIEFIPENLEPGVIYISNRYSTAAHLCCCGCGLEVVTPLNPAKWKLTEKDGVVSLYPSVGNWSFPCQSHYWINSNQVQWAEAMAPDMIAAVKARDRRDADTFSSKPNPLTYIGRWLGKKFFYLREWICEWWKK